MLNPWSIDLGDGRRTFHRDLRGRVSFSMSLWEGRDGLRLLLRAERSFHAPPDLVFAVRVTHPAAIACNREGADDHSQLDWDLLPSHERHHESDVRNIVRGWLQYAFTGDITPNEALLREGLGDVFGEALDRLLAKADPRTVALARGVGDTTTEAFAAFAWLLSDPTGRLAQLIDVSPGAFAFALQCERRESTAPAAEAFFHAVQAGARLRAALAPLVRAWASEALLRAVEEGDDTRARDRFAALARLELEDPDAYEVALVRQVFFILRAPAGIPAGWLDSVAPPRFAPEDIPRPVLERIAWYGVMIHAGLPLRDAAATAALHGLSAFLSRHAKAVFKLSPEDEPELHLGILRAWVRATGTVLTRRWNPERVFAACGRWAVDAVQDGRLESNAYRSTLATALAFQPPDTPLPTFGPSCRDSDLEVVPLATLGAVAREGEELRHCVVTHAEWVLKGRTFLYSARVGTERLTVELERQGLVLIARNILGYNNTPPSIDALAALGPWLRALAALNEAQRLLAPPAAPGEAATGTCT